LISLQDFINIRAGSHHRDYRLIFLIRFSEKAPVEWRAAPGCGLNKTAAGIAFAGFGMMSLTRSDPQPVPDGHSSTGLNGRLLRLLDVTTVS
jgi:hypothetical protein